MKSIGQSITKADNDVFENRARRKNEDSFSVQKNVVAVSDGAGGIGIFADKWSNTLVQKIPAKPFENVKAIDNWIKSFWEEFYMTHKDLVVDDPWKIAKFESEGSLATLSALWHLGKNKFQYQRNQCPNLYLIWKLDP